MAITLEQVKRYGFDLSHEGLISQTSDTQIKLFPETLIQEPPWLILTPLLMGAGYLILSHRTDELTSKYKGQRVYDDWVIKFCAHHADEAKIKTANNLEQSKKLRDEENLNMLSRYKERKTGLKHGTNLCPVCNGDGGIRKCYKCEGTGWV